jgi:hypothetical protein
MKPSFEKTVDILVKAYLNDTLEHGNCYACAVGNLVADSLQYKIVPYTSPSRRRSLSFKWEGSSVGNDYPGQSGWATVFCTNGAHQELRPEAYHAIPSAKEQIDATGYTWRELAKIEFAFERGQYSDESNDEMFNGLMAVVEVLADIHGIALEQKEEAKLLFVKP